LTDELAYPTEEPETSADELALTSFLYPVEDDVSADELDHTIYVKPIASKRQAVSEPSPPEREKGRPATCQPVTALLCSRDSIVIYEAIQTSD
jgi:hypothetical protein